LAELERPTIAERMALGKSRAAKAGKWIGGPIPFGYDVDAEGQLIPSAQLIEKLGLTEAEAAKQVFANIAGGSSTVSEAVRLSALGVPCVWRCPDGKTIVVGKGIWRSSGLCRMLRNTVYVGRRTFRSKTGPVECSTQALVDEETFRKVALQLTANRKLSTKNAKRT
jgi:site-specific DNA recombinase